MKKLSGASIAVVLGSGLGAFADKLRDPQYLEYKQIKDFPVSTVDGHSGRFVHGFIGETPVLLMQGRVHRYEGYSAQQVIFPIRKLREWGVKKLVVTNVSGGINDSFGVGDWVLIRDHLNLTGDNPLIGKNDNKLGLRFPDMSDVYSAELRKLAHSINPDLKEGVYAGVLGPCYETPAEIQMLKLLGADMVGMSTVYETIAANHMDMDVLGLSCVANLAAGMGVQKLSHEEVTEVGHKASQKLGEFLVRLIPELSSRA
ncbi:MAG: purine-nucleoside phosphorylase [Deltaproteobacteria bacterium]|nr:purine-nucleoside phosphorylase [Deltaproteobacteria bacterium]